MLLCYDKDRIFMNVTDGEITFPTYAEAEAVYPAVRDMWTYLFTIDETAYYLISRLPFEEMPDYAFEKDVYKRQANTCTPLTSWAKLSPYASFSTCMVMVRRPMRCIFSSTAVSPHISSVLTVYKGCSRCV